MNHTHSIHDDDPRFLIDPISREIIYDAEGPDEVLVLIQGDHNSERFTFDIPRYIDGHDMSLCNKVYVHSINIDAENPETRSKGVYEVKDLQIDANDEDLVVCSWLISQEATTYVGTLNFVVSFTCITGSTVDYIWNTGIYSGVVVREGINNGEVIVTKYADVLEEWHQQLIADSENGVNAIIEAQNTAIEMIEEYGVIAVSETEPTAESVVAWIHDGSEDSGETFNILTKDDLPKAMIENSILYIK